MAREGRTLHKGPGKGNRMSGYSDNTKVFLPVQQNLYSTGYQYFHSVPPAVVKELTKRDPL